MQNWRIYENVFVCFSNFYLFFCSCNNCVWVATGYHYDSEGNYVEEGYYDCPENNPVDNDPIVYLPNLNIGFTFNNNYDSRKTSFSCSVKLNNSGNGAAKNVKCLITVYRMTIPNIADDFRKEYNYEFASISSGEIKNCSFGFQDKKITITGNGLYEVYVNVTFTNDQGEKTNLDDYFEM